MEIPNLSPEQIFLIQLLAGFIAAGLAQLVKVLLAWYGIKLGRVPVTFFLFAISLGLGVWWLMPKFPPFPAWVPDPVIFIPVLLGWLGNVISLGVLLVGYAIVIYNLLMQKVFEKLGWDTQTILAKTKVNVKYLKP